MVKYRIYELSARAVMSHAVSEDGQYTFHLSRTATEKCKIREASHEQESNALFFQIMCELRGNEYQERSDGQIILDLSDLIFYMDFERIFDRSGTKKNQLFRQQKAEAMFRPEGIGLDFGSGEHHYLAFERSNSMSRQARLSFIRADYYDTVRRRIMLDMEIKQCQLSKLYAYNGLMLSSGTRVDGIGIDRPHRVIVIDNPITTEHNVPVITVEHLLPITSPTSRRTAIGSFCLWRILMLISVGPASARSICGQFRRRSWCGTGWDLGYAGIK